MRIPTQCPAVWKACMKFRKKFIWDHRVPSKSIEIFMRVGLGYGLLFGFLGSKNFPSGPHRFLRLNRRFLRSSSHGSPFRCSSSPVTGFLVMMMFRMQTFSIITPSRRCSHSWQTFIPSMLIVFMSVGWVYIVPTSRAFQEVP